MKKGLIDRSDLKISVIWGAIGVFTTSCTNSLISFPRGSGTTGSPSPTASTAANQEVISTVAIAGTATPVTSIYFDTAKSSVPITTHCTTQANAAANSKPCNCQFSWTEINPKGGTSSSVPRVVTTPVLTVQPNLITCNAPDVYLTEIIVGTQIAVTLLPANNNPDAALFSVSSYNYTTGKNSVQGSFQDSAGHIFDNILHYSCFEKFQRGMNISSKLAPETNAITGSVINAWLATQFCIAKAGQPGGGPTATCPSLAAPTFSAEAGYFNLFIRNSEQGDFNQFNDGFTCPLVKESLNANGTLGTTNQAWPLDATFALSIGPTSTFTVGVDANTKLSTGGTDATASTSTCAMKLNAAAGDNAAAPAAADPSSNSFVKSCLGFAAQTNSDGTCPYFTDSFGQIRFTYRLRRYVAIYPRVYDTNGQVSPIAKTQEIDTVYVLDRPVKGPSNADPLKPYTMRGPKPCPFAYFDTKGVATQSFPAYVSTNNIGWAGLTGGGTNVDGIEFPNTDSNNPITGSCSAALPVLDSTKTQFSIVTVANYTGSGLKHVYIRPGQPWAPHYEEDTDFKACAPQAYPLKDAPLHFSKDPISGNVGWCTESYPTQNDNIKSLDPALLPVASPLNATGAIAPFTSHVQKNSASNACTATPMTIPQATSYYVYPALGFGRHPSSVNWFGTTMDKTCDRTVSSQGLSWTKFPLLAPPSDLEAALSADSSYYCTVTYDNSGPKTNLSTPSDGCCNRASVSVKTGAAGNTTAHLEPDVTCQAPAY